MKFKIGDKVRINKDSFYYNFGTKNNPKDIKGIISKFIGLPIPIRVKWNNDEENSYNEIDLEYWYLKPLKELLKKISIHDKGGYETIKRYIEMTRNLTDEELKLCSKLWKKYNKI